ncbi:alternate gene name: yzbB [Porphyromonas crevioricanis JCM 15906]|nr:alternate gene name: yzbB [Porphyromonas crevioricanis JCM 15906]SJZ68524.1 Uncharacterized conserved protein YbbC, DUF1343 family [Porphyromonas crevioricanis]
MIDKPVGLLLLLSLLLSCVTGHSGSGHSNNPSAPNTLRVASAKDTALLCGAERMELLLPLIKGKRVALFVNQTSVVGSERRHLVDTLLSQGVHLSKIFVPEHGFRGTDDAGAKVAHERDPKTGLYITSLYSSRKKPSPKDLADVDVIVFDMQDVGARFYTYISSMHYAMEAAAEEGKEIVVCDRPNPNDYVDGPLLESDCRSFVGMHPIPVLHGLTMGELAIMINSEGWLQSGKKCHLTVIPLSGWEHGQPYQLPVSPSPNLKTDAAVRLYPSLCFFEATIMSVGRGTDRPFEVLGYPDKRFGSYRFVPHPMQGASKPLYSGRACYGVDLSAQGESNAADSLSPLFDRGLSLAPLIHYYRLARKHGLKLINRRRTFELLAGNKHLSQQLESGLREEAIRATWQEDLSLYRKLRNRYLLYPDNR